MAAHLDSGLWQVDFERHLLPHEYIRIASFCEKRLQHVQLGAREGGALAPLLPGGRCGKVW